MQINSVYKSPQTGIQYTLIKSLGEGQFGNVILSQDDQGSKYAMKFVQKLKINNLKMFSLFQNELKIMQKIRHHRVLSLLDYIEDNQFIIIISQYCNQGNLEEYLQNYQKKYKKKGLDENVATQFVKQILEGFSILNEAKIMHRDLKLANIMIHNNELVIGDFGFAKLNESIANTKLGTPYYMAPELFEDSNTKYTNKVDIWAIGVCYFILIFGQVPFSGSTVDEIYNKTLTHSGSRLKFPRGQKINIEIEKLLRLMLEPDPSKRISFSELFNHQFIGIDNNLSFNSTTFQSNKNENNYEIITLDKKPSKKTFLTSKETLQSEPTFRMSHVQSLDSMSRMSVEDDGSKQQYIQYYYHKNMLIFMIDTFNKLIGLDGYQNLREINVIQKVLEQVIIKKVLEITSPLTESINKKQNFFNVTNFDVFSKTRTFYNFQLFFNYLENYCLNIYKNNKKMIQCGFNLNKIDSYDSNKIDAHIFDSSKQFYKFYQLRKHKLDNESCDYLVKTIILVLLNHNIYQKFPITEFQTSISWKEKISYINNESTKVCENYLMKYFENINQLSLQIFFMKLLKMGDVVSNFLDLAVQSLIDCRQGGDFSKENDFFSKFELFLNSIQQSYFLGEGL